MRRYVILAGVLLSGTGQLASAAEDYPAIQGGGRVHVDYTFFDRDKYPYADGGELRRGRAYVGGNLSPVWDFRVQVEFSGDEPELKDGYLRYSGAGNHRFTLGNFKQFSSLEYLTSSNNMTFTERAMVNALVTDRRMGAGFENWSARYTLGISAYTHEANNNARGNGYGGRFVYRPAFAGDALLHLGVNVARESPDGDRVRLRARPDSHQDSHRIVDTGVIAGVDNFTRVGLEAAYVNQRFSAQAEYVRQDLSRLAGGDLDLSGYYLYASYFLTGDSRPYSNSSGAFGTLTPSNAGGAWELAARFSSLDLTDQPIAGGQADTVTLGVNYYLNRDVRLTANYIMADADDVAGDDDPNALQLRLRITF